MQIDGAKEVEEFNSVFWELGEILVDHLKGALEHIFHDRWHLIFHKRLESKVSNDSKRRKGMHH